MDFSRFCTPAQLYLILAGISLLTAFFNDFKVITLVVNGLFVLIWGWILNWLCSKGLKAISWILVLLPFILFMFTFFFAKDIISNAMGVQEGFQEGAGYVGCLQNYEGAEKRCKDYGTKKAHTQAVKDNATALEKQRLDSAKANKGNLRAK